MENAASQNADNVVCTEAEHQQLEAAEFTC
jgi:hypothetical protein